MTGEPRGAAEQSAADDALRREQMSDPVVRKRLREVFDEARKGETPSAVTAEELPDFLRGQGR